MKDFGRRPMRRAPRSPNDYFQSQIRSDGCHGHANVLLTGWPETRFEPARLKEFIKHGANIAGRGITWTHSYWGEIACGNISAESAARMRAGFASGSLDQRIILVPRAPHFGGRQWYFMCPVAPCLCFGSQIARCGSAVGRPGAGKSLTNLNSTTPRTGLTLEKRGSSRD